MKAIIYHERTLSGVLSRAAQQFPAVIVTGPRQSGKTTLVRHLFGKTHRYCSLDEPSLREQAISDPRLLLSRFQPPVILDEIQYCPDLLHYVKLDIDAHRGQKGRYVITGSQTFPLMQNVSESLAGRAAVLSLQSMSIAEVAGRPGTERIWDSLLAGIHKQDESSTIPSPVQMAGLILRGGFPEPALDKELELNLWQSGYLQTYLERDVRTLRSVGDLRDFQRLLFALAARTGGLVNYAELGRDLGINAKTVKAWLSVLEASGQIVTLTPYHTNLGKRLVKRPKIYFLDTGLLSYLLALETPQQVLTGMSAGPLFEAAVLGQLYRLFVHRGLEPRLYFWQTAAGHEVDFLVDRGSQLIPFEAKVTATPSSRHAAGLERFQKLFGKRAAEGFVVCLCKERHPLTKTVDALPFGSF